MAETINLRTARKHAKRKQQQQTAAANRLAFGVASGERRLGKARRDKAHRDLDRHRLDKDEG